MCGGTPCLATFPNQQNAEQRVVLASFHGNTLLRVRRAGYRGKTARLARSMGFSQVNWLGTGNTVEASIVLPDTDSGATAAPRRTAAAS